jgi:hypothetical protein
MLYDQYGGLGSKVGFVFAGILALAILFVVFCIPECKGKSLEQIDRMFNEDIALRKFGKYRPEEMTGDVEEMGEKGGKGTGSIVVNHREQL